MIVESMLAPFNGKQASMTSPVQFHSHSAFGNEKPLGGWQKRTFDVLVSAGALVLLAPILALAALLVRLCLGRQIIFAHPRVGENGRIFYCYKFRTMVVDADSALRRHLAANRDAELEWRLTQKLKNDPRVCSLGRLLRRSSIDELPQLFNVLKGDMSIVGPRPIVPGEIQRYGIHAKRCFKARPGITGLWQVNGRNRLQYRTRVALDRLYSQRWSLGLDLAVLLRTVPVLMKFDQTS